MLPFNTPNDLVEKLKEYIIGQDEVLKVISLYLFKFSMALDYNLAVNNKPILLLTGQTGMGKTYTIKKASELMNFKVLDINSKSISQEGWHGQSFIQSLKKELEKSEATSSDKIIVLLDEFDKICIPEGSSTDDNVNQHIQYSLLKYLEQANPDSYVYPEKSYVKHKQLCFILAGNFEDLRQQRKKKMSLQAGFTQSNIYSKEDICVELMKYGMIPEIAGRISEILELNAISKEQYNLLLKNDNFFLNIWVKFLEAMRGTTLDINWDISIDKVIEKNVGVRGLIQEVNLIINDILDNSPEIFVKYTQDQINAKLVDVKIDWQT